MTREHFEFFFGHSLIFIIDMKSQKKLVQSDKRSMSKSPSLEKVVLRAPPGADRVKFKIISFSILLSTSHTALMPHPLYLWTALDEIISAEILKQCKQ